MRILVADDDYVSRHALMSLLKKYGDVDAAVNGVECLGAVEAAFEDGQAYSIIFMDIMMPEMDGLEAAMKIRELEKQYGVAPRDEAKVVMATAMDDPKTVFAALNKSEATEYMVKPCGASSLQETLARLGVVR